MPNNVYGLKGCHTCRCWLIVKMQCSFKEMYYGVPTAESNYLGKQNQLEILAYVFFISEE